MGFRQELRTNKVAKLLEVTMAVKFLLAFLCLTMVASTMSASIDGYADAKAEVDKVDDEYTDTDREVVTSNFKSPVIVSLAGKNAKVVAVMATFLNFILSEQASTIF